MLTKELNKLATTLMQHMINPEVLAKMISYELEDAIRFIPLADVDNTLVGQPGDTLKVPKWGYIGDAADLAENTALVPAQMSTSDVSMTIKKAAKGVELTDEAVLSGYGDPIGEAVKQIRLAIVNHYDDDLLTALQGAVQTSAVSGDFTVEALDTALGIFNDEESEPVVLIASPMRAAQLRAEALKVGGWLSGTELGANRIVNGTYGEILGAQIVRSRKLEDDEAFLVKRGALKVINKRGILVEYDRDILKFTNVITASKHYGTYLADDTKAVKITFA